MLLKYPMCYQSILITSVLNCAYDRLLISIPFSYFSGVLICSFICAIFPCLLNLAASLCLFLCIRQSCFDSWFQQHGLLQKVHLLSCYGAEPQVFARVGRPVSLICCSVWGRARREDIDATWPLDFCLGGSCLLALALMPIISPSPCMPLVPFQLLSCC